jgi:glutamine amidotransferase
MSQQPTGQQRIVILDYGMGNLRSVQKAFELLGYSATIADQPEQLRSADKLVLPGVGAFRDAIARLREGGFVEPIRDHLQSGKPFLGICLGLQLLFDRSYEDGEYAGLGILAGEVVRFPPGLGLKVPHMGWNELDFIQPHFPLARGLASGVAVYFVHSYYALPRDPQIVAATADYYNPFTAAVWHENILAVQFHPEKSQQVGLRMLENFARL